MIYIVEYKENNVVVDSKQFKSIRAIAEALNATTSAVAKNFKCSYDPNEKPSKKISQTIFDYRYNVKAL